MQAMQQFCLRWNNHQPNFISVFTTLLSDEALVDVTLACEGKHLQAHRVVLSACSAYFQSLFTINPCQHPIVILKDIKFNDLKTMVDFMYYGEVNVSQEQLPAILKIAEMLKIKGLADMPDMKKQSCSGDKDLLTPGEAAWRRSSSPMSPAMRRKRLRKSSTGSGSGSTEQTSEEIVGEGISGHSPSVKIEHVEEHVRSHSRQSLRYSNQEPSTDSEPREGSQDSGAEDYGSRVSVDRQPSRQLSNLSNLSNMSNMSYENRQISIESRQGSYEVRQESRQASLEGRQASVEGRQASVEGRQASVEGRQASVEGRQASCDGTKQTSHDSRLSHESSVESVTTDPEASSSNLSPSPSHAKLGTKRGRLLMRQPRIKKESDTHTSPDSDPGSPSFPSLLTVSAVKMERQRSEPAPGAHSPPPHAHAGHTSHLLTVPQPSFSVRQHSFSTQSPPPPFPSAGLLVRQVSQPPQPPLAVHVKSVQTADDPSRSASPSIVMEPLPIVRIIAEAEQPKMNSHRSRSEEVKRCGGEVAEPCRSVHCPVLRTGPALGCNFCWNTIDAHGRILRRKTKYHCPECQTNLCIVPCFQEYHHRQTDGGGGGGKPEQSAAS